MSAIVVIRWRWIVSLFQKLIQPLVKAAVDLVDILLRHGVVQLIPEMTVHLFGDLLVRKTVEADAVDSVLVGVIQLRARLVEDVRVVDRRLRDRISVVPSGLLLLVSLPPVAIQTLLPDALLPVVVDDPILRDREVPAPELGQGCP